MWSRNIKNRCSIYIYIYDISSLRVNLWHVSFTFSNSFQSHVFQNSGGKVTDTWQDSPVFIIDGSYVFHVIGSLFLHFHVTVRDWSVDIFQMIGYSIHFLKLLPLLTVHWCCLLLQTSLWWRSRGGIILRRKSVLKENSLPIFMLSQTVPYVYHPAVAILSVTRCKLGMVVNVQNYADIGSHLWLWRKFGEVWNLLWTITTSSNLSWPVRSDKGGIIVCDISL